MRKVFYYSIIAFLFVNLSYAQKQTLFLDKDYNTVLQEAQANRKPIVIMFYATWCAHCNAMKNTTFNDVKVIDFYQKNYNCMAVNAESPTGIALKTLFKDAFKIKGFPTFVFLAPNESLLYANAGEFSVESFITEGQNVLIPDNQISNLRNKFEANIANYTNTLKYIIALQKAGLNSTPVAQLYLRSIPKEDQFNSLNWRIVANGISDLDSDEFIFIIKNKDSYAKVSSPERVDKKIVSVVSDNFNDCYIKSDTIKYNKSSAIAATFQMRKVDSLVFVYDMGFATYYKNWKKYQKVAEANVEKFAYNDASTLNDICNTYLVEIDDKKGLQNAVNWSNHAIDLSPSKDKYIMTTKLLIKMKSNEKALETAQKGKAFVESYGWKTTDFDNLITEIKSNKS